MKGCWVLKSRDLSSLLARCATLFRELSLTVHYLSTFSNSFFLWLYPVGGGNEDNIEKAALGVLILWVGWFAFNCGSLQNIDGE